MLQSGWLTLTTLVATNFVESLLDTGPTGSDEQRYYRLLVFPLAASSSVALAPGPAFPVSDPPPGQTVFGKANAVYRRKMTALFQ